MTHDTIRWYCNIYFFPADFGGKLFFFDMSEPAALLLPLATEPSFALTAALLACLASLFSSLSKFGASPACSSDPKCSTIYITNKSHITLHCISKSFE